MDILDQLAVALGFATLAGINLYLTVLITGLAIRFDWITLFDKYADLAVLGETPVLAAAAVFFIAEFFADKVPWVDSLWDSVHTLIRPIGGGLLAMHVIGDTNPAYEVIIGLLAGGTSLVAHTAKAGTRLAINTSPEPVSNVVASTAEDAGVVGGFVLMSVSPILFGLLCLVFLGGVVWVFPKLLRRIRATAWLFNRKILTPAAERANTPRGLPGSLSVEQKALLAAELAPDTPNLHWAVPVVLGRIRRFPGLTPNTFAKAIADPARPGQLFLIGRRSFRSFFKSMPLENCRFVHEPRFLSEDLVVHNKDTKSKVVLRLPRGREQLVDALIEELESMQQGEAPVTPPVEEHDIETAPAASANTPDQEEPAPV